MGFRYIQKVVKEFQGGLVRDHYNDLIYTALTLFNAIVDNLRRGYISISFVDTVLGASRVIEETTLMRAQMEFDVAAYRRELTRWHLEDYGKALYRIPGKVDTFTRFRDKKSCKVKDYAIEIVTKMYRIHQMDLRDSS
jgi:hypothetical protein